MRVLACDPGRNIGIALVSGDGELLNSTIVREIELQHLELPQASHYVIGDGTGSGELSSLLKHKGIEPTPVDETGTSLEARKLYFRDHPPGFLMRLVPFTLQLPPRPIDDYAAYAIALRFLAVGA